MIAVLVRPDVRAVIATLVVAIAVLAMLALGFGLSLVHTTPAPAQVADGGGTD